MIAIRMLHLPDHLRIRLAAAVLVFSSATFGFWHPQRTLQLGWRVVDHALVHGRRIA